MSIFHQADTQGPSIFDRQPQQQAETPMPAGFQQKPPQQQQHVPSQVVPGVAHNNVNSNSQNPVQGAVERQGASLLDKYAESVNLSYVEPEAADPNKPTETPKDLLDSIQFADVHSQFRKQNLTGQLDEAKIEQVLKEGSATALKDLLNEVAQNAASAAMFGSLQLTKNGMSARMDSLRSELPKHMRDAQVKEVFNSNGFANRPEVRPLMDASIRMFQERYPQATPQQLKSMVDGYMQDFMQGAFSQKAEEPQQQSSGVDFRAMWDN